MGFLNFLLRPEEKKKQDQQWNSNQNSYGKFLSFLGQSANEAVHGAFNATPQGNLFNQVKDQAEQANKKVQQSNAGPMVKQATQNEVSKVTSQDPANTAKDFGVSILRSVPRSAASIGLGLSDKFSTSQDKSVKEIDPSTFQNDFMGQTSRALLGTEKIEGPTSEGAKTAELANLVPGVNLDEGQKRGFGTVAGVPLAVLGLALPGGTGGKKKIAEEGLTALAGLSKTSEVVTYLNSAKKSLGLSDDVVKRMAPDLAKADTADKVKSVLSKANIGVAKPGKATTAVDSAQPTNQLFHGSDAGKLKVDDMGNINLTHNADDAKTFGTPVQLDSANLNVRPVASKEEMFNIAGNPQAKQKLIDEGVDVISADNHSIAINPESLAQKTGNELRANPRMQSIDSLTANAPKIADQATDTSHALVPAAQATKEPKNQAEYLVNTLKELGVQTPEAVGTSISEVGTVKRSTPHTAFLEGMKSPSKVLTSHFGAKGGDIAYELQKSAHAVEQGQQVVAPMIDDAAKLIKHISKSDAGKKETSKRIYAALEDRTNADQYLQTDAEKALFGKVAEFFDMFKEERQVRGLAVVGENYGPRAQLIDALTAPDRMMQQVTQAFKKDTISPFSKERTREIAGEIDTTDIVGMMRRYANSQLKEFGYTPAIKKAEEALSEVNPAHLTDKSYNKQGIDYLQKMFQDALSPQQTTRVERLANKALQTTYRSALSFNPRFIAQNFTQRWLSKAETSLEARSLSRSMDKETLTSLRSGLASGDNPFFTELSGLENSGVKARTPGPFNISNKVEMKNITMSYDRGASQAIVDSEPYKAAIKAGMKPKEAAKQALADPATKDLAERAGNMLVNRTQFGANIMTKPEFFRSGGMLYGVLPKSFVKQYGRFQAGIIENLGDFMSMKKAREYDIMARNNPAESQIVDYKRAAEAVQGAVKDMTKAVKRGEIQHPDLTPANMKLYKNQLDGLVKVLDKEIKGASQVRGHKKVAQYAKMWAAATAIQFLFSGGGEGSVERSARYASPVNVPSKDQNPLTVPVPSITKLFSNNPKARTRAALNFVPGVGVAVNRAQDFSKMYKTLTGGQ